MKANKALKRLTKIEGLLADVVEKYSAKEDHLRHVLQDAKTAINRAKEAVSLRASTKARIKSSESLAKGTLEPSKTKHRVSAAGRKAIIAATKKRWALKRAETAKAQGNEEKSEAKKSTPSAPVRKTAERERTASVPAALGVAG